MAGFLWLAPVEAQKSIESKFVHRPPRIDGRIEVGEWDEANRVPLENGYFAILNDGKRAYFLVNVWDQTRDDAEDNLWLTFDVDGDKRITPEVDVNFALDSKSRTLGVQEYLGTGRLSSLRPVQRSSVAAQFESFAADGSTWLEGLRLRFRPHRVWEAAIALEEIRSRAGRGTRLGLRVASPASGLILEPVEGFERDFSGLMQVEFELGSVVQALADPEAVLSLEPDFLELTQAVQTRQNAMPLVAGKRTLARVYVSLSNATRSQPATVYLHGRRGGLDLPGSPLLRTSVIRRTVRRGEVRDTPWFVLPESWLSGTVEFRVRLEDAFGREQTSAPLTRTFQVRQVPLMWIIPVNTGSASSPNVVSEAEIASQMAYLRATYPVADVNFVVQPWTVLGANLSNNPIPELRSYYGQLVLGWIFGLIFTGSAPFDLPMQVYGFTPGGGGESDPLWYYGSGHGYVARGYRGTSREGTMAHEINHNLDRSASGTWGRHVPLGCGASGPDPAWPYGNDDVQEFGFDPRMDPADAEAMVVVPNDWPDFMSYCQSGALPTKWISPYRYQALFNVFAPSAGGVALHQARLLAVNPHQRLLHLSGRLYRDGGGRLHPVLIQPGVPSEEPGGGPYALELQDGNGKALRRLAFAVNFEPLCEDEPPEEIAFDFQVLPPRGTVAAVVLLLKERVLDKIEVSANAPSVTLVSPNGGEQWSGVRTVEWSATDRDRGAVLSFDLLYSPNNGRSWIPVAERVTGRSYAVDTARLPGSSEAKMRVLVSDGFHTDEDDSDRVFSVVGKPPRPFVIEPGRGELLYAGQWLRFVGEAEDPEDGALPESALHWAVGKQMLGTGRRVQARLPEGRYEVALTAVDSDGNAATQRVPFEVVVPLGRMEASLGADGRVRLGWLASLGAVLESGPEAGGPYEAMAAEGEVEGDAMVVKVKPEARQRFYRLVLVGAE